MLDSQDMQKIEEVVTRIVRETVTEIVTQVVTVAIQQSEERMRHFVRAEIRENNVYLIQAIATMIDDNVAPQFADVHRKIAALAM